MPDATRDTDTGGRLTIGSLSRATGIPVETLRTWEQRYGFPEPERKTSGHRVYPLSIVGRLQRISAALARGHRAGEVVRASDEELDALLATPVVGRAAGGGGREAARLAATAGDRQALSGEDRASLAESLAAVSAFDAPRLTRHLEHEWARLGPFDFLHRRIAPLVHAVGECWARGELEIRHEHFLSERVADLLRALRVPFEDIARGPLVVLTTLPGESHSLGLQMSSLVMVIGGCRVLYLGPQIPPEEAANVVREMGARALGLSVSVATAGKATAAAIAELRRLLPRRSLLLVGGAGAPEEVPRGVEVIEDLDRLHAWAQRLSRVETTAPRRSQ